MEEVWVHIAYRVSYKCCRVILQDPGTSLNFYQYVFEFGLDLTFPMELFPLSNWLF